MRTAQIGQYAAHGGPAAAAQRGAGLPEADQACGLWNYMVYALLMLGIAAIAYFQFRAIVPRVLEVAARRHGIQVLAYIGVTWMALGVLLVIVRTILWIVYRPSPAAASETAPHLTVIIPAYNEGAMVLQSIESAVNADYPRDRLEVLVVDDGSKDDTWNYILEAARRHPSMVTAMRHDRNRGKREALALGFSRARGEILVTIDSDSVIERGALLALAGPFRDARVGAVAGKVLVYNRAHGVIPRMLHVRFILSFDMLRAAESVYRNVYCCPGALTAYRATALRGVLERWKCQEFLGLRCTFGEDRAMTNYLLGDGYDSVYQRTAVVHTVVPNEYGKLCKMLLRWDRSYVREEIRFARIVWTRPWPTRALAVFDRSITNARIPIYWSSLAVLPVVIAVHPRIVGPMVIATGALSFIQVLYYLRSERSLNFAYGVLYAYYSSFALFWIFPYAVATVRARGWLTR
ncbi:MAG: glycosyltransferase family 2 protein [Proteobacteria bacterium]|nr:glycosyltransferase family 2 protein [Pseudomonadota bacterium]